MNNDIERILISQDQIDQREDELAAELTAKYQDQFPIVVSVLTGAMIFTSDMLKRLNFKLNVDLVDVSSYAGANSTGEVQLVQDLKFDVSGRSVIVMEDIIDTGRTLAYLVQLLKDRGAKSVEVCALLDKPERREAEVDGDYVGFKTPNEFLVGYGLDYNDLYRNLPYVGILKRSVYEQ
ncbi:hypoxanthine phosphoribosyltransferase [Limosilactobacillus sp.]|jgi:hypoxanthine phosphoribosyltransferase|uniref:hypoxanthine phosphoribosyltransferase n=1 Tax=Limosilactobacillus sp. TaxID=2773925 RepID=UPI0025B9EFDF|nr:hypoxanthine phosphoribosyltransferase [Limosilactobacillus sp.]MCH3923124.1 hypoxanthine phosphoribosyltransferase [Limosilactobacillus sp.]MCH3927807.1 hypoxanthine phosphoribosyltransferase [Limosilactobacillus sp.]